MKWILVILGGIVGLLVLIGIAGYYFLSKPIDPNSDMSRQYAQSFKASFMENCIDKANAATQDQAIQQQIETACECGAEATYEELKAVPPTEQYSRLQEPEMQQKLGSIMQACMQSVGAQ